MHITVVIASYRRYNLTIFFFFLLQDDEPPEITYCVVENTGTLTLQAITPTQPMPSQEELDTKFAELVVNFLRSKSQIVTLYDHMIYSLREVLIYIRVKRWFSNFFGSQPVFRRDLPLTHTIKRENNAKNSFDLKGFPIRVFVR